MAKMKNEAAKEGQQLISPKVLAFADKEMAKKKEREKQEKFGKFIVEAERVQDEIDAQKFKLKAMGGQLKRVLEEVKALGFNLTDVKTLLAERRVPQNLFDQQWKDQRKRIDGLHEILGNVDVERNGNYDRNHDFFQRAMRVCLEHKGSSITPGLLMGEMGCKYNQAASVLISLEVEGILSARDESGARSVVWVEDAPGA